MIRSLFSRNASQAIVERLYSQIVAASRRPAFFQAPISIPDTVDGRTESLILHASLILRRLSNLPEPAPALAQELTDRIFRGFDEALREMGVGDLTVPKRIKNLAGDFGGRSHAYARGLDGAEELAAVLARNVFGSSDLQRGQALAKWLRAADATLSRATFADFEQGLPELPMPETTS